MKIALLSDFHLGFGKGTERFEESFENAKGALELAIAQKPDCILLLGDLFDSDIPNQETWHNAFKTFSQIKQTNSECTITRIKNEKKEKIEFSGIPLIAIHGTHEYRGKDFKNAVEVLESAGFLIHLHAGIVLIEKGNEKIAVHGLGGVPEKHALDALKHWNPMPVEGATNILLLHQSIKEFLPFNDEMIASISLSDLPKGFDLIADGHLHWNGIENLQNCKFLLTGSTIITQMKKLESENKKAIEIFDSKTKEISFLQLPNQRQMFYEKISFKDATQQQILETVDAKLSEFVSKATGRKPLIRLKLVGTLAKEFQIQTSAFQALKKAFLKRQFCLFPGILIPIPLRQKLPSSGKCRKAKNQFQSLALTCWKKTLKKPALEKQSMQGSCSTCLNREKTKKQWHCLSSLPNI